MPVRTISFAAAAARTLPQVSKKLHLFRLSDDEFPPFALMSIPRPPMIIHTKPGVRWADILLSIDTRQITDVSDDGGNPTPTHHFPDPDIAPEATTDEDDTVVGDDTAHQRTANTAGDSRTASTANSLANAIADNVPVKPPTGEVSNGVVDSFDPEKNTTSLHKFTKLPPEIQDILWELIVRDECYKVSGQYFRRLVDPIEVRDFNDDPEIASFLPDICRLSRETRQRTIAVVLRRTTFIIRSYQQNQYFTAFLACYDGYRSIRRLPFESFDWLNTMPDEPSNTNSDLELCVRSAGLKEVSLLFHTRRFHKYVRWLPYNEDADFYPVAVQSLWDHYKLDRLIATENINKVTILHEGRMSSSGNQTLVALIDGIKTEFQALDRVVAVSAVNA